MEVNGLFGSGRTIRRRCVRGWGGRVLCACGVRWAYNLAGENSYLAHKIQILSAIPNLVDIYRTSNSKEAIIEKDWISVCFAMENGKGDLWLL